MRCFIGVPVPDPVADTLVRAARPLRNSRDPRVNRWSHPRDYHITLAFLGQIDPARVPDLLLAMAEASASVSRFSLCLNRIECFPQARPKVVAAMPQPHPALHTLQHRLVQALDSLGIRLEDRRFHAHLSLARLHKKPDDMPMPSLATTLLPVEEIALYCSDPRLQGPRYSVLGRAQLSGEGG